MGIHISRKSAFIIGGAILGIVILQLLFPYDRAYFNAKLDNVSIGLKTEKEIETLLRDRYKDAVVITKNPDTKTSFRNAGVLVSYAETASRASDYPVWQRLLPLSALFKLANGNQKVVTMTDPEISSEWAAKTKEACAKKPIDAAIVITEEFDLTTSPSQKGRVCDEKKLVQSLNQATVTPNMTVDSKATAIEPARGDAAVQARLKEVESVVQQGITVTVLGTTTSALPSEIVSWLKFSDGPNNSIELDIEPEKVQSFVMRAEKPIYVAPGTTIIRQVDGQETSREEGAKGRGIDRTKLIDQLRTQLRQAKTEPIVAVASELPAKTQVLKSFSNSTAGLNALLADIAREKGDMSITLREMTGQGRIASVNGTKQYQPASTYKLFVAYSMIKRVESGALNWSSPLNGTSLDECMTRMIVNSDNDCPRAFAAQESWGAIQADIRAIGMTTTNLNTSPLIGTTSDQALFLEKFYRGQLMKDENKNKLLELMKRQRFRQGIPAGVPYQVADKVGFLTGLLHDSAIVYAPKGDYVLSIYSDKGTWADIADAARRINQLLQS